MKGLPIPPISRRATRLLFLSMAVAALLSLPAGNTWLANSDSAFGASVANIAGLLGARSPGERTKGELNQLKKTRHSFGAPLGPTGEITERVPGRVFPPETDDHLLITPEELLARAPLAILLPELSKGAGPSETSPEGGVFGGGGGGDVGADFMVGGGPGGSGGGGAGGGGGALPDIPPAEIPAVPEPSTWVLMLLGAALCGASMRRQRRLQLKAAA